MKPNPGISVISRSLNCRCNGLRVTPGRRPTGTDLPVRLLIRVDLPTFERPTNMISWLELGFDFDFDMIFMIGN